jgi:hypothetical protein
VLLVLGDYIISTVGPTVYIYRLNLDVMELEQVAQFYAQVKIKSIFIIKNDKTIIIYYILYYIYSFM